MTRRVIILTFIVLLTTTLTYSFYTSLFATKNLLNVKPQGTFLWDEDQIGSPELLPFLQEKGLRQLYLQVHRWNASHQERLRPFISGLRAAGIEVYALEGRPEWTDEPVAILDWIAQFEAYQQSAAPEERFKGLMLDIEPHLLEGWETDRTEIVERFVRTVSIVDQGARTASIYWVIPFWYDRVELSSSTSTSLAEWMISTTDATAIMAYRNFSEGKDGILDHVHEEMIWSEQYARPIKLILETMEQPIAKVSFHIKGQRAMQVVIDEISETYRDHPQFEGISIHYYEAWKGLKP